MWPDSRCTGPHPFVQEKKIERKGMLIICPDDDAYSRILVQNVSSAKEWETSECREAVPPQSSYLLLSSLELSDTKVYEP